MFTSEHEDIHTPGSIIIGSIMLHTTLRQIPHPQTNIGHGLVAPEVQAAVPPPEHPAGPPPHHGPVPELGVRAGHVRSYLEVGVLEALGSGGALVGAPLQTVLD